MAEAIPEGQSKTAFTSAFSRLAPAILSEWAEVDSAALAATGGELEKVVAVIAGATGHTKALLRRQLQELYYVVTMPPLESAGGKRPRPAEAEAGGFAAAASGAAAPPVDHLLEELERRTAQIMRELRGGFLGEARDRVKDNVFFSLLVAVGLGFIVGVLFTGFSRGK
jgi:hypothetical protein